MGIKSFIRSIERDMKSVALKSDVSFAKHAAVLINPNSREKVLSIGFNRHHSPDRCEKNRNGIWTEHAEANAIFQRLSYVRKNKGLVIYVLRVKKDGSLGNSKPCEDCQRICKKYNIETVYYSAK